MAETSRQQSFDVVVVGGDSAGAVVAARLSEDPPVRVALVEVDGVAALRVAGASVMATDVGGDTDAASTVVGEKATEMIAQEHHGQLVGTVATGATGG